MGRERLVRSQLILNVVLELQRHGSAPTLECLDEQEPELAGFVMEQLSAIRHDLWAAGLRERQARQLYRRIEQLTLGSIVSLRQAVKDLLDEIHGQDGEQEDTDHPDPPDPEHV